MRTKGFCQLRSPGLIPAVALLRCGEKKVDRGKARVCHFGPYGEYRLNERSGAEQNTLVLNLVYYLPIE